MFIYCLIFIFLAILAIEYENLPWNSVNLTLVGLALFLSLFAGLRGTLVDRDYEAYLETFNYIVNGNTDGEGILPLFEPGFSFIVKLSYGIIGSNNAPILIMLVFAFVSVFIKVYVFKRLSINPFVALLLYFCHFFLFQEMTQIRNGLACSLFLLAVVLYLDNYRLKAFLLIVLAILFHNSALLYMLIFLLSRNSFNRWVYLSLFLLAIFLGVARIPFLSYISGFDLNLLSNKLTSYAELSEKGGVSDIKFFTVLNTCNIIFTGWIFFCHLKYKLEDNRVLFLLKCNILAIFIYGLLVEVPSMATRFYELFWAVFPILFSYLIVLFPFKRMNIYFIIGIALIFFYINLFHGKLLMPYRLVSFR